MRLADVYLMYAEAVANGYGTPGSKSVNMNLTAVGAVNKVRDRAHVKGVNQIFLGNTEDFMKEVRRERAVELAFEGHRFNDLRRWLLLTEYPYTLKTSFAVGCYLRNILIRLRQGITSHALEILMPMTRLQTK